VLTDANLARKRVWSCCPEQVSAENPLQEAVLTALSVRDPDAPPVTDDKGNIEPDPELRRDYENVPLPPVPVDLEVDVKDRLFTVEYRSTIADYMDAEVLPYVLGRVG